MNAHRFDTIARLFARRRREPRQAIAESGAGIAAASLATAGRTSVSTAQEATPPPANGYRELELLFVQSFQSGSIAPQAGAEGRYTATFEHGLGETIYFSDRPDRIVGALPTQTFLDTLGFTPDNPPNAAILTDNGDGETTLAVVELFAPTYDADSATVTYEMAVLDHWQDATSLGFTETPVDLGTVDATFGSAHLFIDGIEDCPDEDMWCKNIDSGHYVAQIPNGEHDGFCRSDVNSTTWWWPCLPCSPWYAVKDDALIHWSAVCNERYERCEGHCEAQYIDSTDA